MLDVHGTGTHMEQDVRNLDLNRADLATRTAQRRREGKGMDRILLIQALSKLRREDGADGTGVNRTVGVTRSVLVDRADIHAGTTTDACKGFAANGIRKSLGASVIHQDQVEFLRAITRSHSRPHRGVGVHTLTCCRAGEKLGEDLDILVTRNQLFDTHQCDECIGKGQAHTSITFRFEDRHGSSFSDAHVGA